MSCIRRKDHLYSISVSGPCDDGRSSLGTLDRPWCLSLDPVSCSRLVRNYKTKVLEGSSSVTRRERGSLPGVVGPSDVDSLASKSSWVFEPRDFVCIRFMIVLEWGVKSTLVISPWLFLLFPLPGLCLPPCHSKPRFQGGGPCTTSLC